MYIYYDYTFSCCLIVIVYAYIFVVLLKPHIPQRCITLFYHFKQLREMGKEGLASCHALFAFVVDLVL